MSYLIMNSDQIDHTVRNFSFGMVVTKPADRVVLNRICYKYVKVGYSPAQVEWLDEWWVYIFAIVVLRDSTYFIFYLKSSLTSTLVVNKSAFQIFNPMVVLYQKIAETLFYYVGFLKCFQLLTVPYFLNYPRKIVFFLKNIIY